MPLGLTASTLLARATGLANRASTLAGRSQGSIVHEEIAGIELAATNVRTMLTDVLRRGRIDVPLPELQGRITTAAARLDEIEEGLRDGADAGR